MLLRDAFDRASYRVRRLARPLLTVTEPPTAGIRVERDVEVPVRDGTVLRVNVFRPDDGDEHPVLMCAHPYGKDVTPERARRGGYRPPRQNRLIPQSQPYAISAWTSWEAPDPVFWVERGYAVVNADLRGWGTSDGVGELLSAQEGEDYHDLIEWAGTRSWSNGKVGLAGVSYLALAQWAAAATRPPHLAAIAPWEGFTDAYRDLMRPGGIREDGFVVMWAWLQAAQRRSPVTIRIEQRGRPLFDGWWAARNRDIERIEVPALVCGSFSDQNLHSGGSFKGFDRIGSTHKWLYTHRGPKWSSFYGEEGRDFQARFFDHFLRGDDTGITELPPVRLEVRESADRVVAVRHEAAWPLPATDWQHLHLDAATGRLGPGAPRSAQASFDAGRGSLSFTHRFEQDTELSGPMVLRLHLEVDGADDVSVFAGVRKRHGGRIVGFEGSYGFRHALVTSGWCKASHRAIDPERSTPWAPFHPGDREQRLAPGQVVALDIELLPSATLFRAGDELEAVVQGRWFFPQNPLFGQFPAGYQRSAPATCTVHTGGEHDSTLLVPVIPPVRS